MFIHCEVNDFPNEFFFNITIWKGLLESKLHWCAIKMQRILQKHYINGYVVSVASQSHTTVICSFPVIFEVSKDRRNCKISIGHHCMDAFNVESTMCMQFSLLDSRYYIETTLALPTQYLVHWVSYYSLG